MVEATARAAVHTWMKPRRHINCVSPRGLMNACVSLSTNVRPLQAPRQQSELCGGVPPVLGQSSPSLDAPLRRPPHRADPSSWQNRRATRQRPLATLLEILRLARLWHPSPTPINLMGLPTNMTSLLHLASPSSKDDGWASTHVMQSARITTAVTQQRKSVLGPRVVHRQILAAMPPQSCSKLLLVLARSHRQIP